MNFKVTSTNGYDFHIRSESGHSNHPCNQFESEREAVEWLLAKVDDDQPYADFIMERAKGERIIGNGDQLIEAMESGDYWDDYVDQVIEEGKV